MEEAIAVETRKPFLERGENNILYSKESLAKKKKRAIACDEKNAGKRNEATPKSRGQDRVSFIRLPEIDVLQRERSII